jgi:hypothetical protein
MLRELSMKWVISVNNLDCLLLLLLGKIGKNLIKVPERNLPHITMITRKENLISLQLQKILLKNLKILKQKRNLNLINIFHKKNALTVDNQDILLTSVQNLPKRLNKKLML